MSAIDFRLKNSVHPTQRIYVKSIQANASVDEAHELAKEAIRILCSDQNLEEIVLATEVRDTLEMFRFPNVQIYWEMARTAGFELTQTARQRRHGYLHELILVRDKCLNPFEVLSSDQPQSSSTAGPTVL